MNHNMGKTLDRQLTMQDIKPPNKHLKMALDPEATASRISFLNPNYDGKFKKRNCPATPTPTTPHLRKN